MAVFVVQGGVVQARVHTVWRDLERARVRVERLDDLARVLVRYGRVVQEVGVERVRAQVSLVLDGRRVELPAPVQ